jgi:hypothetical protein
LVDPDGVTDLGINEIAARFEELDARPGLGALGIHCVARSRSSARPALRPPA